LRRSRAGRKPRVRTGSPPARPAWLNVSRTAAIALSAAAPTGIIRLQVKPGVARVGSVGEKRMPDIEYEWIGVCGLSCILCPMYHSESESRCEGCKSEGRIAVGCPFITCAVRKRGIEFCWECPGCGSCEKWAKHREAGRKRDSFKCYRTLDADIRAIRKLGLGAFIDGQRARERLLKLMLSGYNEGRSRTRYCIAATVLPLEELESCLARADTASAGLDMKGRARTLKGLLDDAAARCGVELRLRK